MQDKLLIKYSNKNVRGTWKPIQTLDGTKASFVCPECGKFGVLYDHEILSDGVVNPSVVCYNQACDFHRYIILERWDELLAAY